MHTLLFDIDGTLIRTGGAGFDAMRMAMLELFGLQEIPDVDVHGRTDRGILADLFETVGLDYEQHGTQFSQLYWQRLPKSLEHSAGHLLPDVMDLLEQLSQRPEFSIGILTGNAQRAAEIKLKHFELAHFFKFGGYGDDHGCRNEVARQANESAANFLGDRFEADKVWVIGDTVNDIKCARAIGARVLAVETGGASPDELRAARPDAQFSTLNPTSFLQLFP